MRIRKKQSELIKDPDLFTQIAQGNRDAESELFRRFKIIDKIDIMVRTRFSASHEDQNDLIGEILSAIIISLRKGVYDPSKGSFSAYIHGITKNKLYTHLKKDSRFKRDANVELDLVHKYEPTSEKTELKEELVVLINSLDKKYREIIYLKYCEDMSTQEIAKRLKISQTQIYNRLHYALKLLRERIKAF